MDARIQQKIAPPVARNMKDLNDLASSSATSKQAGVGTLDFKNLLLNSNREVKEKREAQKNGDLSSAKTYEDFIETLNKKTQKKDIPSNKLDKDDFLKLFVTQLQNQDPLNPKDGAEMASQLAQFNSLEQMLNLNKTLSELSTKTDQGHSLEFINFIGKEVSIKDGRARVESGHLSQASFKVGFPVSRAKLEVRDSVGQVVAEKELGALAQGEHILNWDGINKKGEKVGDGIYTFSIIAYGKGDTETPIEISSRVRITGVDMKDQAASFYTQLGKIGLNDIVEIGEQGFKMGEPESKEKIEENSAAPFAVVDGMNKYKQQGQASPEPQQLHGKG